MNPLGLQISSSDIILGIEENSEIGLYGLYTDNIKVMNFTFLVENS